MPGSKRVELVFDEVQPKNTDDDERDRRVETALENFAAMIYDAANAQNAKEGKARITKSQAWKIVLYWAKNL